MQGWTLMTNILHLKLFQFIVTQIKVFQACCCGWKCKLNLSYIIVPKIQHLNCVVFKLHLDFGHIIKRHTQHSQILQLA